jgi:hypothetical protein
MREGEESYKGDRNKLYTICEACSRFFSKGELTPEEIALWRQARKHLQPFVAQDLQEFNGRSLFMQTVEVDRICELLALSGYDNNEDEAFQTFMKNFPHKVIQRGTN